MQRFSIYFLLLLFIAVPVSAQEYRISDSIPDGVPIQITNLSGRVSIKVTSNAEAPSKTETNDSKSEPTLSLVATADKGVVESEIKFAANPRPVIEVLPAFAGKQINITVTVPLRSRLSVQTDAGAVDVSGNLESIDVKTGTGTVSTDIPDDSISYDLAWTEARPRYLADFELEDVKEGSAGKFYIRGSYPADKDDRKSKKDKKAERKDRKKDDPVKPAANTSASETDDPPAEESEKHKKKKARDIKDESGRRDVFLRVTTARGIVLLNVDESEVGSDLRERPLTTAAKAIIQSGDTYLMEAIRRASPKYFGEYAKTLPPAIRTPYISEKTSMTSGPSSEVKTMLVNVTDLNNRSIGNLEAKDFEVVENGETRDVLSVRPVTAPFNLVLLLDVSGSVDNYVNFIRKAARQFVDTMGPQDRIAIVTFNDDVHIVSSFSTNKAELSKSLDTFDAGGATAYYDALAFVLADTLRPLRGDRTAIVVLTDGDDNRSFLPFDALKNTIAESGALIYPLYVPSSLIAASATAGPDKSLDWLRQKYMGLTAKVQGEGEKLAHASGGVYYPITQLSQIQTAYDDIAKQLRTAYSVTFRSGASAQSRLRIKVKKENAFVKFANQ
ncbi:MAG TPA: VWA domain-containing protein [Pyrinomonadaceae bacterium]|nr:VWA domain-containing protein [Pyrinomonadaceae bacterium]